MVVSNTYCTMVFVLFFFVFLFFCLHLVSCVPNVSLDIAILITPSVSLVSLTFIREVLINFEQDSTFVIKLYILYEMKRKYT